MASAADSEPRVNGAKLVFQATYQSLTSNSFEISENLAIPNSSTVADRTEYLSALRKTVAAAQDHINKELTSRMEEDKAREAIAKNGAGVKSQTDEAKEEENYGEEEPEEED